MITELTAEQYKALGFTPMHCYNSTDFVALNAGKVQCVHYLAWFDHEKLWATLILGEDEDSLRSPFSAPFGGFDCLHLPTDEMVETIFNDLKMFASGKGKNLYITLPPPFYSSTIYSFAVRAMNDPSITVTADYNFHYTTADAPEYDLHLPRSARRNLRLANEAGFHFQLVMDEEKKKEVYDVIRSNREALGYPLRMTFNQVMDTSRIVNADFFLLRDNEKNPVAAAICFHAATGIVQLIYWGELLEYRRLHPMSLLAMHLFRHYYEAGITIVDVGPSSTDGIPNRGLCAFKQNIGCRMTPKFRLKIT
ncbi:MAG: GNAT family N-acetyltransferase [Barnesiella sp.]|nr:GNAT family N-acetyltransferase [Barnesiella sp.]